MTHNEFGGPPSDAHDRAQDALIEFAFGRGYTEPCTRSLGGIPDVLLCNSSPPCGPDEDGDLECDDIFIGEAKATEGPNDQRSVSALNLYMVTARDWLLEGSIDRFVFALCPSNSNDVLEWASLLNAIAQAAGCSARVSLFTIHEQGTHTIVYGTFTRG